MFIWNIFVIISLSDWDHLTDYDWPACRTDFPAAIFLKMSESPSNLESSVKRIRIVTAVPDNYINSFVMNSPMMMNSPIIRTPHDSQTLDEFKGIFTVRAPQPAYSPCKTVVMDYQMSPVKRVVNPLPLNSSFLRIPELSKGNQIPNSKLHDSAM